MMYPLSYIPTVSPGHSKPRTKNQTCRHKAMSKSSDTFSSDQIFFWLLSLVSSDAASWSADQWRKALCLTKGATSPVHAGHRNTLVDAAGRVCDTILKIVMSNLHDIYPADLSIPTNRCRHTRNVNSPESCWMIATSGHSVSSRAVSRKQSWWRKKTMSDQQPEGMH
jgi:hypothetical protein